MKHILLLLGLMFLSPVGVVYADSLELEIICGGNSELQILCFDSPTRESQINPIIETDFIISTFFLSLSIIWILIYYSKRLQDLIIPLRLLFLGSAIFLLVNLLWLANQFGEAYGASINGLNLINASYFIILTTSIILAASLFILTIWQTIKIAKN